MVALINGRWFQGWHFQLWLQEDKKNLERFTFRSIFIKIENFTIFTLSEKGNKYRPTQLE